MTYTCNIAGEKVEVKKAEIQAVKTMRHCFAVMSNAIYFQDFGDSRPMQMIIESLGEDFEKVPRGYYDKGNIVFFIGQYYRPLDNINEMHDVMRVVYKQMGITYGQHMNPVAVWNGITIGKPGEFWTPKNVVAKLLSDTNIQMLNK